MFCINCYYNFGNMATIALKFIISMYKVTTLNLGKKRLGNDLKTNIWIIFNNVNVLSLLRCLDSKTIFPCFLFKIRIFYTYNSRSGKYCNMCSIQSSFCPIHIFITAYS